MVIKKIVFCEKPYGRGITLNSPVLPGTFEGLEIKNWQVIPLIMKACFSLTPQLGLISLERYVVPNSSNEKVPRVVHCSAPVSCKTCCWVQGIKSYDLEGGMHFS